MLNNSVGRKLKRYDEKDCRLIQNVRLNHLPEFQGDDGDISPERETTLYGKSAPPLRNTEYLT
jgi:hypothetical protein